MTVFVNGIVCLTLRVQLAEEGTGEAHRRTAGAQGADGLHVGEAPWPRT